MLDGKQYAVVEVNERNSVELPKTPQKEDCVFEGWFLDKDDYANPFDGTFTEELKLTVEVYGKWSDAPCEHNWSQWKVSKKPTCKSAGENVRSCTVCGKKDTSETEKTTEHNFVSGTCTVCGEVDPNYENTGLKYALNDDGESYSVIGIGTCNDKNLVIPSVYNSKPVTKIGENAFSDWFNRTSITIPDSIISIAPSAFAFYGHVHIDSSIQCNDYFGRITVSKGNTSYHSEGNCLIETKTKTLIAGCKNSIIPDDGSVTSIGDYAFTGRFALTNISIPNYVTSIGNGAFNFCCHLKTINIPSSVISIDNGICICCHNLESITVAEDNAKYHSQNNCLIETENRMLIAGCKNSVIPGDGSVKTIAFQAFQGCTSLTSITIPNSITSIHGNAFMDCTSLTSITIPNSVTSIYRIAFANCASLTSITIPSSVTHIDSGALCGCSGLESITVAEGNKKYYSTNNCIIETESKTLVLGCKNSVIPNDGSVTSIADEAFDGCHELASVTIPDSVTSIGKWAFEECSGLTSIIIPDSITYINVGAFRYCDGLTSITIPNSVSSIGVVTFEYCRNLTIINFKGTIAEWNAITKGDDWNNCVPAEKVICTDGEVSI